MNINQLMTQIKKALKQNKSLSLNKKDKRSPFITRLLNNDISSIIIIGDSIAVGAQCDGYSEPVAANRTIITWSGHGTYKEPRTDWTTFPTWVNLFREYISSNYPSINLFNKGIGGFPLSEFNTYKELLVPVGSDVVFFMLGTNDMLNGRTLSQFKSDLEIALSFISGRCKTLIVLSPPPSNNEFTNNDTALALTKNFSSRDMDNTIANICEANGYIHISLYKKMLEYAYKTNINMFKAIDPSKQYLSQDGVHPSTFGYKIIWRMIQEELGFVGNINYNLPTGIKDVIIRGYDKVTASTPLNDSLFQMGSITYDIISSGNATKEDFPGTGTLITFRPNYAIGSTTNDLIAWGYQEYQSYGSSGLNCIFRRYWDNGGNTWSTWKRMNDGLRLSTTERNTRNQKTYSTGECIFDSTLGKPIWLKTLGAREVDTLTINTGVTAAGSITITLNGVAIVVALASSDTTPALVAAKIRASTLFTGWYISGIDNTIVFTKIAAGVCSAPAFADTGSTGVSGNFAITTTGAANVFVDATGTNV